MPRVLDGIGIGVRRAFVAELPEPGRQPDFIELIPENWVCFGGKLRAQLDAWLERYPAISHSTSLSIGGLDPLDTQFLDATAALCEKLDAPFFSDHICYSSVHAQPVHDLLPLPFTREAVAHTAERVKRAERHVGRPLILENATFYAHMPGAEMDEAAFLTAICESADCGLLLDVNNVYVNSRNHGFSAEDFIDRMPLERVRQLHMAGHTTYDGVIIDTHIGPIIDPVWELYRYTLRRAGRLIPTLIEWDQDVPPLATLLDEVDRARAAAAEALTPSGAAPAPRGRHET